jgi:restriction system protein
MMELSREDGRIIQARPVISGLDPGTNLAAMDWQDFEHLIREVFEKEFAASGAEVRVTRASRDYGVDAIVFDPDAIRGGKYVIQAKRYTDSVGVDAVRDLYGTVTHEGANRGILVTTSSYGPESYEWSKDKPITLIDGPNLLSILRRHGHDYRIDLAEAKRLARNG